MIVPKIVQTLDHVPLVAVDYMLEIDGSKSDSDYSPFSQTEGSIPPTCVRI